MSDEYFRLKADSDGGDCRDVADGTELVWLEPRLEPRLKPRLEPRLEPRRALPNLKTGTSLSRRATSV